MGRMPRARTFTTSWCSTNSKRGVSRRCVLSPDRQHKSNKQGPVPRVERTMVAITVDLKTKGLALRPGASLQCRAFMKFRGPKALNDKLPVTRLIGI
jgi:hypothetical protein